MPNQLLYGSIDDGLYTQVEFFDDRFFLEEWVGAFGSQPEKLNRIMLSVREAQLLAHFIQRHSSAPIPV